MLFLPHNFGSGPAGYPRYVCRSSANTVFLPLPDKCTKVGAPGLSRLPFHTLAVQAFQVPVSRLSAFGFEVAAFNCRFKVLGFRVWSLRARPLGISHLGFRLRERASCKC